MAFPWASLIAQAVPTAVGTGMSLFGKKRQPRVTQLPTTTSAQQELLNQLGPTLLEGIQDPTKGFEPIAEEARADLQSKTLPMIANRFGGLGALRSSGYQSATQGAGTQLERSLAAQKALFGNQRLSALSGLLGQFLRPQFENIYEPGGAGVAQMLGSTLMGPGLGSLSNLVGSYYQNKPLMKEFSNAIETFKKAQARKGTKDSGAEMKFEAGLPPAPSYGAQIATGLQNFGADNALLSLLNPFRQTPLF